ncbi:hypothetical protein BJ508DRAFT_336093 [Ascobolus immersus RN42]|uniref:F-box domain-containing protein n=1 Tax=Ascobolus immersus RN42 TaxID=1160509 RepID=A0A3N4HCC8_ASCIM|nr:hypothetical protein BJ508DRAFT_336093 [Ascobolus immersus RN42]
MPDPNRTASTSKRTCCIPLNNPSVNEDNTSSLHNPSKSLLQLPNELLHIIATYVDDLDDFKSFSAINRHLRAITKAARPAYIKQWNGQADSDKEGLKKKLVSFIVRNLRMQFNMNVVREIRDIHCFTRCRRSLEMIFDDNELRWKGRIDRYLLRLYEQAQAKKGELVKLKETNKGWWFTDELDFDWEALCLAHELKKQYDKWIEESDYHAEMKRTYGCSWYERESNKMRCQVRLAMVMGAEKEWGKWEAWMDDESKIRNSYLGGDKSEENLRFLWKIDNFPSLLQYT